MCRKDSYRHVRIETKERVDASLIIYIDEDDEDGAVALAEFPDLAPAEQRFLEAVGFFQYLEAKGRQMDAKFATVFDARFAAGTCTAPHKDPQMLKAELEQAVAQELHEACERELQAVFKAHMLEFMVIGIAEEKQLGFRPEDTQYLCRIGFPEKVRRLQRDIETEAYELILQDQVDFMNFAVEPGRLPLEKRRKLAELERMMGERKAWGEAKVKRVVAEELKRHLADFRKPGSSSARSSTSPFPQWSRPGAHKV
ncbi:hypothetical protein DENSPDRAFT_882199 [Dentipellis sp. KUC8613]|nr:hypothetical protein DENSPDRAFT_882199 [Dentipellis sp. KUC8613]